VYAKTKQALQSIKKIFKKQNISITLLDSETTSWSERNRTEIFLDPNFIGQGQKKRGRVEILLKVGQIL
jgi:hypothetical protein